MRYAPGARFVEASVVGTVPTAWPRPGWTNDVAFDGPGSPVSPFPPRGPASPAGPCGPGGPAGPAAPAWPSSRLVAGSWPGLKSRASSDPSLTFDEVTASRAIVRDVTEPRASLTAAYELP